MKNLVLTKPYRLNYDSTFYGTQHCSYWNSTDVNGQY